MQIISEKSPYRHDSFIEKLGNDKDRTAYSPINTYEKPDKKLFIRLGNYASIFSFKVKERWLANDSIFSSLKKGAII